MTHSPPEQPRSFEKSYRFEYPREIVYNAWISEATVIPPASSMQITPKKGGAYRLIMGDDVTMEGRFSEVVPNQRLISSWQWAGSDERTEVNVQFSEHPTGTEIQILHRGFASDASLQNHASGWDSYVNGLRKHLHSA